MGSYWRWKSCWFPSGAGLTAEESGLSDKDLLEVTSALTLLGFRTVPAGFIPAQDKGYMIVAIQLPDGASLARTDAVVRHASAWKLWQSFQHCDRQPAAGAPLP